MAGQLAASTAKSYRELSDDLGDLEHGWSTLRELSLNEQVNTRFQRAADRFAALLQASLFAYCVALVGRLLEDITAGRKKTCSLRTILAEAAADGFDVKQLQRRLRDANRSARKIIAARHERIAHNSYAVLVEGTEHQLFTFAEFDATVAALTALMNDFERLVGIRPIDYRASEGAAGLRVLATLLAGTQTG